MNKKIIAIICVFISLGLIFGIITSRYIRNERKADEENYLLTAGNAAYQLSLYIETGDKEYFSLAAADIVQMSLMTDSAEAIVKSDEAQVIKDIASALSVNEELFLNEAQRLCDAFSMIEENGDNTEYAYAQIKIAFTNSGL